MFARCRLPSQSTSNAEIEGPNADRSTQVTALTEDSKVICTGCESQVGEWDTTAMGVRLFKPFLVKTNLPQHDTARLPMSRWLSSYLLSLVDSCGVRKFQGGHLPLTVSQAVYH